MKANSPTSHAPPTGPVDASSAAARAPAALTGVAYLMAMPQYGQGGAVAIRPGLERISALLDAMGHPEAGLPVIHVAGTNGKGTTASMTAAILAAHGMRVGLHTSPHLLHPGERMRINGEPAPEAWVGAQVDALRPTIETIGASYFEVTVALSLLYFRQQRAEVALVEVGLGGRLDATNILAPSTCIVTRVGLDHTQILGESLTAIAREKAGIIKTGVPVVSAVQHPEVGDVLAEACQANGAALLAVGVDAGWDDSGGLSTPRAHYRALPIPDLGPHTRGHVAMATLAAESFLNAPLSVLSLRSALAGLSALSGLRGRFERWREDPLVVLDVGHNPEAMLPLIEAFVVASRGRPARVLMAIMADKELDPIARKLSDLTLPVHPLRLESPRALSPEQFADRLNGAGVRVLDAVDDGEIRSLVDGLPVESALLVAGSHQVVAAFLRQCEG